jgi:hypothetical protein
MGVLLRVSSSLSELKVDGWLSKIIEQGTADLIKLLCSIRCRVYWFIFLAVGVIKYYFPFEILLRPVQAWDRDVLDSYLSGFI